MATAKKAAKKPTTKKAPAKAAARTSVKRVTKRPFAPAMRSFAPARPSEPFFTFRITHQTLYWLVLAIVVLALGVWVTDISVKVQRIYDQIDATNAATDAMVIPKKTPQP
jgi:hypothetical protein